MDEFGLIQKYFAPLCGDGAFGLSDDVALLPGGAVSKDVLVEGIHFRSEDPLDRVAQKALRVNLSDLVAKGCTPTHYLLGLVWRSDVTEHEVAAFADGLRRDQSLYGVVLLGGDTTRGPAGAPMVISVTMVGKPIGLGPVRRSGAHPGDTLMVTGTIGNSGLGLMSLRGEWPLSDRLTAAYQLPTPPIRLQDLIAQKANASLDVSDGLVADAAHLATASGVGLRIQAKDVPLSEDGRAFATDTNRLVRLLTCGDDYQALFTAPADAVAEIIEAAHAKGVLVTDIGTVTDGQGVQLFDESGGAVPIDRGGYQHF